jgi:hypothetical protein
MAIVLIMWPAKTRIDQTTMRVCKPLIQAEVGERGLIAVE